MSGFSHAKFGNEVRIEQYGKEVHLIFVAKTQAQSNNTVEELVRQLKGGAVNIALMGIPTSVEES